MVSGFLFVHLARGKLVGHRVPGGSALTSVLSLSLPLSYGLLGRDIGRKEAEKAKRKAQFDSRVGTIRTEKQ